MVEEEEKEVVEVEASAGPPRLQVEGAALAIAVPVCPDASHSPEA